MNKLQEVCDVIHLLQAIQKATTKKQQGNTVYYHCISEMITRKSSAANLLVVIGYVFQ